MDFAAVASLRAYRDERAAEPQTSAGCNLAL